jgi:hypothetical protein
MSDRLWPIHFKAISTPKPRTPKQNDQEAQTLTEAPATAIITAATTAITTAATTATKTITRKAKGRALLLERWYKRLGYLNYADVKQLATNRTVARLSWRIIRN